MGHGERRVGVSPHCPHKPRSKKGQIGVEPGITAQNRLEVGDNVVCKQPLGGSSGRNSTCSVLEAGKTKSV